MFTAIFVTLFVLAWLVCGYLPWFAVSVGTGGRAGLAMLPVCLAVGVLGGLAVPVLGKDDEAGIWISMLVAALASAGILGARLLARSAVADPRTTLPREVEER